MQEEQGKKNPETGELPGLDDKAPLPAKPTDLPDADLDKVAGGVSRFHLPSSNVILDSKIAKNRFTP